MRDSESILDMYKISLRFTDTLSLSVAIPVVSFQIKIDFRWIIVYHKAVDKSIKLLGTGKG